MKKGLFFLLGMFMGYMNMAQVPHTFSYQMVIRNGNNELVANTTVGIRIGLLGGNAADTVWYEEEHKVKTNLNGLAYITIGKGNILKGAISTIDWMRGPFFIKSETDPTGGTNYSLIIVSQMLSVPYAIYAKTAEKLSTPVTESDPLFSKSIAKGITAEDTARWSKREGYDGNSGSGGVVFETDPVYNASVAKGIRSIDTASWNNKLNLRDTMNLLRPYLRSADTVTLSNRLNQKVDIQQLNTNTLTLDGKINIADTAGMLSNYRAGINAKVNISDTLNMLIPYLRDADTTAMLSNYRTGINTKVNIADTAGMLTPYLRKLDTASVSDRINLKVNIADTAGMLTPYLRKLDTASVSDRINLKVNIADTAGMLTPYLRKLDTVSVSNRINLKVNIADTAGMLMPYLRKLDTVSVSNRINLKVNIADTAGMLMPYLRKLDTASVSDRINLKVNIADTAGMLTPYLRKLDTASVSNRINLKVNIADTAGMLTPYLRKLDTASVSNRINLKVNIADTAGMLMPYLRKLDTASVSNRINLKVNIADTAGMLMPYLRKLDTASVSNRINLKVNIADTAGMLTPYLRKLDTASVSNRINLKVNIADTAGMLTPYLRKLDTASVSNRINLKVNIADTAGMLTPYLRKLDTASVSNRINLKVNIADTAGMLMPYLRKLDTASVSNRINLKVNIADTASMLEPYLREPVGPVNGDILYYNINKWERLPKGQDGQFLTLSSGIPNWTSIAPGSPTGVSAIAGNGQVTVSFTAPTNTGGTPITGYTVTSSPSGGTATGTNLSLTVTGLTNGTSYTFTVVATNSVGNSAASLSSTPVTPCINTAGPASSTLSLCINTTLSNITHSTTGATGIGSAIGLPTGVSAAWASNTITISGTPTVSGTFNYSIPLTGGCGSVNATGTITVTDANIAGAASSTPTLCINTLLIDITHSTLGATGIGSATGLPTGVSAAWASNTITISGTPNASGTFNYSIPLTGGCGSVNATGTITVACIPTVTTTAISSITTTGASSGGNVTDEGGVSVIARGVVYSTSPNPTISNSTTSNGTGAGSFTSTLTSLTSATTYYVRAYATNSLGTAYGNELTFSTSAPIPTATLNCPSALGGIITFMKHNLGANQAADPLTPSWELNGDYWLWGRQTKAADGPTESNTNAGAISGWNSGSLTLGAMGSSAAWLDGSKTANDPCPSGFRVPTKEQWRCVIENNTKTYQGTWSTGFGSPTNYSTGLTLTSGSVSIFLPAAGSRASNYDVSVGTGGDLQYRGRYGNYLSSSLDGSTYYFMQFYDGGNASGTWTTGRTYGYSVRCVAE